MRAPSTRVCDAMTEEEQRRAAEEERARRRREKLEKHALPCPHCGKSVLDHMTRCPYCGGALQPKGYSPMDEKKKQRIRTVCYVAGTVIAVAIALIILFLW